MAKNLGKFLFNGGAASSVSLSDWTGESGKNVWFDAMMWIQRHASSAVDETSVIDAPATGADLAALDACY